MTLRAVLFDLDDTLHDKSATLRRFGQHQHTDAQLAARGVTLENWLSCYIELNNQRIEKSEVFSRLGSRFNLPPSTEDTLLSEFDANLGQQAVPFPGAHTLVAWCKDRGLKVGIVTNGRDDFQRSKIAGMGLGNLIDVTLTSGGYGVKKPDHAIFNACLTALKVKPTEAAFVGDDFSADMEPAIDIGMHAIWKNIEQSPRVAFSSNELPDIHAHLRSVA
jgi:putative hydrolase of the HAD superfamily